MVLTVPSLHGRKEGTGRLAASCYTKDTDRSHAVVWPAQNFPVPGKSRSEESYNGRHGDRKHSVRTFGTSGVLVPDIADSLHLQPRFSVSEKETAPRPDFTVPVPHGLQWGHDYGHGFKSC
ncbi:hypothetical protein Landi51_12547 [Colletotrichum acutatum]